MNASATIRAEYIRASTMNMRPMRVGRPTKDLQIRPAEPTRLANFKPVNHLEHREVCESERKAAPHPYPSDPEKGFTGIVSFMDFDADEEPRARDQIKRMYTVFPWRDPTWIVSIVFFFGAVVLTLNGFFELLPQVLPQTIFEHEEKVADPVTGLTGALFFLVAGILDTSAALNADRGTLSTSKDSQTFEYKPALLGSREWNWIPSSAKFRDLLLGNLAFQAGLLVLFGGFVFAVSGFTDFPGILNPESETFELLVFIPQIVHGAMFLIANLMLAIAEQETWWKLKVYDPDWQGSFLNAVGGLGFMFAGLFGFMKAEEAAAWALLGGSAAFLVGSLVRWYVVMQFF
ncbi:hypothetical protein P154DRAFT_564680 [Amniculicola lignicola CBS 123094]|uniref:Integral membrane protein n=1 Tax=Amniculicola lignicola CBS 123094 TaxID=1392246 RepID=A0A6A5WBM1_9PLEO|nr:hypothetical protein P154DRAFT_564680 [Amniculicola lignicola CBS 123094]